MKTNRIKLLVFDWDGTLADSEHFIVAAMQAAITEQRLAPRSPDEIRSIIGLGLMEAVAVLFPGVSEIELQLLTDSYRQYYSANARGKTTLFPEVIETLSRLQQQDYKLAIATGKSRKGLDNSLRETGIGDFFQVTRCADETFSKPNPQMLIDIMNELVVTPENTLMIGDSEFDLLMAKNANVAPVAVTYGTQTREQLLKHAPLACLDRLDELPVWLEDNIF